jgi:hypothetical protein
MTSEASIPEDTIFHLDETEAEVMRVLTDRGRLDEYQISSGSNIGLIDVETALATLVGQGLLDVQTPDEAPQLYSVKGRRLGLKFG